MNRRDFLALLAKGGAAAVALATVGVDPEFVGWEAGRKAFSLPAQRSGRMVVLWNADFKITPDPCPARYDIWYEDEHGRRVQGMYPGKTYMIGVEVKPEIPFRIVSSHMKTARG